MEKRIIVFGAIAAVVAAALVATLAVLDVIAVRDLTETLGRTVLVIAIAAGATLVITSLAKSTHRPRQGEDVGKQ